MLANQLRSPDLNIIENLWDFLARETYKNRRQFPTAAELKQVITGEWMKIPQKYILKK